MEVHIRVSNKEDIKYVHLLVDWYRESAKQRGTGIAERDPEYLKIKMIKEDAVIAFSKEGELLGFSYIETFEDEKFVVNSGLIVKPDARQSGTGKKIKHKIFELSRTKYPNAKIFSITTSLQVMKLNTELGYKPVTFSELTTSDDFWKGCKSCKNYSILMSNERKMCLCTGLVYDQLNDNYSNKKEGDK
ncbi:MAG: GNAT family N-acetyltransferase [Solirubrobacteraceae bacterium]